MVSKWQAHKELKILKERLQLKFKLLGYLGSGAFSKIFKLEARKLSRKCVLKVLDLDVLLKCTTKKRDALERRFLREARTYAKCNHPNIVSIYDIDGDEGFPYLILEYINGETLQKHLFEKKRLEFDEIKQISREVLPALGHMHSKNLIHRDLNTANLMLENDTGRVVIIDFGIVKDSVVTEAEVTVGTPYYMAPEQWKDSRKIDFRADIYSYGAMLFEMVTGEVPFPGKGLSEIMKQHLHKPVPDVRLKSPEIPPEIQGIIETAMAKAPNKRYRHARDLLKEIEKIETPIKEPIDLIQTDKLILSAPITELWSDE